jgi:hypothetical protein
VKALLAVLATGAAGCSILFPERGLLVMNLDGPPVTIVINDEPMAELVCQFEEGESAVRLIPGDGVAPPMPWSLSLITADGSEFDTWALDRLDSAQELVIRADGGVLKSPGPVGPVPHSNPGCPKAGLQE